MSTRSTRSGGVFSTRSTSDMTLPTVVWPSSKPAQRHLVTIHALAAVPRECLRWRPSVFLLLIASALGDSETLDKLAIEQEHHIFDCTVGISRERDSQHCQDRVLPFLWHNTHHAATATVPLLLATGLGECHWLRQTRIDGTHFDISRRRRLSAAGSASAALVGGLDGLRFAATTRGAFGGTRLV